MEMRDMEHILKILTLAERSQRIGIVLGPQSSDVELLAAHALKERLGEKAFILNAPEQVQDRWSHMFKKEHPQKEFALALDTKEHPVGELRYEKEGGKLRIFLSPSSAGGPELTKDAFELERRYPPSDMVIAIGFINEADVLRTLEADTPLKDPAALVQLGNTSDTTSDAADEHENSARAVRQWDRDAMKLFARAILRSHVDEDNSTFWAFLPKEDFQKTNQSDEVLPLLVSDMRLMMQLPPLCIMLWQGSQEGIADVHALVSGTDKETMARLSAVVETPLMDDMLIIRGFANFSEAELEVRKLIK